MLILHVMRNITNLWLKMFVTNWGCRAWKMWAFMRQGRSNKNILLVALWEIQNPVFLELDPLN